jgi:hypothetical protein
LSWATRDVYPNPYLSACHVPPLDLQRRVGVFFLPQKKLKSIVRVMKALIWIGITVGGALGGWLGAVMDHGNYFGAASILIGGVGSLVGIWAGYKIGKNYM